MGDLKNFQLIHNLKKGNKTFIEHKFTSPNTNLLINMFLMFIMLILLKLFKKSNLLASSISIDITR